MKRRIYILGMLVFAMGVTFSGCKKKEAVVEETQSVVVEEKEPVVEEEKVEKESPVVTVSPISGMPIDEATLNLRPVAIMLDNHHNARWQAGIREAGIVYEIRVEGSYTRYMAVFLEGNPSLIGPIRSARPYFLDRVLEYDAEYVHFGGSGQALADIASLGIHDIDGLTDSKTIWRYGETGKVAPHNAYSSLESIRSTMTSNNRNEGKLEGGFQYHLEFSLPQGGADAKDITIHFNSANTSRFVYREDGFYSRYKDGVEQVDENDNLPLNVRNIIIQVANSYVIDNEGHLGNDSVGSGTGKLLTGGKVVDITWEKSARNARTIFYDSEHKEIILNPGQTWIEVVDTDTVIDIL